MSLLTQLIDATGSQARQEKMMLAAQFVVMGLFVTLCFFIGTRHDRERELYDKTRRVLSLEEALKRVDEALAPRGVLPDFPREAQSHYHEFLWFWYYRSDAFYMESVREIVPGYWSIGIGRWAVQCMYGVLHFHKMR